MQKILSWAILASVITLPVLPVSAEQPLFLAYPPREHKTTAEKIFLIGTAAPTSEVLVNGRPIPRSQSGNFAPSFPLQLGENRFTLRYLNQKIQVNVTRLSTEPQLPQGLGFSKDSLTPAADIARLPGEQICFGAIASPRARVSVTLGNQRISLLPQSQDVQLPSNFAVLTGQNQPTPRAAINNYQGCAEISQAGNFGNPVFQLNLNGERVSQRGTGTVEILSPNRLEVIEVIEEAGVARTGPSTNYSRLTPLPKGTRAAVTGKQGDWLRLDYGAWIRQKETKVISGATPPKSIIRSITSRQVPGATEILFPLEIPVPVSVQQSDKTFTLTLHNLTAQTDTIFLNDDPVIKRLDWYQVTPDRVQYNFRLKSEQQWGYDLRYEGTTLILSLRHPPNLSSRSRLGVSTQQLAGIKILLDPGHGGAETGASGPNGYPEKDVNLVVSKLLQKELVQRGATVYMTRETDKDVSLRDRMDMIHELEPTIALSIHYNALPDYGDAINTAGIGMFWYHTQAHDLSVFLHNYLVQKLRRPSYGVFWNNLALTRPHKAPSVLLELGFMINPVEFEWISNPQEQRQLANAIADGITEWLATVE
ncbi:N-acetylmuramoyl-L-alanine amidase [Moorena bouillonii]|uniref:N-acetylmuramoyl-L-alanine amidase n=1 Tax=Moorena bouillonii PNG TaxID=568701 RepID=A0A1U7N7C1_9CYAN|nr:N-acetylmuramoyl-L-alanine amidase [Moorena bouillonii]OLT61842.1 N-acetylmuramoyl-L-alanine amidase [Moorena bouillonii PNG]